MTGQKSGLSLRELDILRGLAQGRTKQQVAQDLGISPHTLSTHLRRAYRFLDAVNLVDAVQKFQEKAGVLLPADKQMLQPELLRAHIVDGQLRLTLKLSVHLPLPD